MKLFLVLTPFFFSIALSACSKQDDCNGGCKGWKPDSGATDAQKKVYGLS